MMCIIPIQGMQYIITFHLASVQFIILDEWRHISSVIAVGFI